VATYLEHNGFLQKTQGYLRYLMQEDSDFIGRKLILMMNIEFHPFVADFVSYTIDLPREFYNLNLETDCYEAPLEVLLLLMFIRLLLSMEDNSIIRIKLLS